MESDPHDQLLLARRPTTVVRQHTKMFDRMPDPYGSQEDEESLFAGVSGDSPSALAEAALGQKLNTTNLLAVLPGIAPVTAAAPSSAVSKGLLIAGAAAAAWFLFFRR